MEEELIKERLEKREKWKEKGMEIYPDSYPINTSIAQVVQKYKSIKKEELEKSAVNFALCGRIMAMRKMGKVTFSHLSGSGERLQILFQKDRIGDEEYDILKLLDIGDFIGVKGELFRTKTDELTLLVGAYKLLSKCLRPLPEKWHGLTNTELRYRQRYLDLITNEDSFRAFIRRSKIIQSLRKFMDGKGFIEVETPMLQPIAGGAMAYPFSTHLKALDLPLFLRIAPELYLKRLVVGGMENVYEINRNFRNEGVDTKHNPEFTMMEFYMAYHNKESLLSFTEEMLLYVADEIGISNSFQYGENTISLEMPFKRISLIPSVKESLKERGYEYSLAETEQGRNILIESLGLSRQKSTTFGHCIMEVFDTLVQPGLIQPTFVEDYPMEVSPLSKAKRNDPSTADRFELFISGMEIANGFSELNIPEEQKKRFLSQLEMRRGGDEEAHQMDEDYCTALEYGLPPTAGEGIGIDRLAMLFCNRTSIRDVLLFPILKP